MDWRHAPPGSPLWELLPRDVQEHVARFLKQKLLAELFATQVPRGRAGLARSRRGPGVNTRQGVDFAHMHRVVNLMSVTPLFDRDLCTVYLLSVPIGRWHHQVSFANGLARLAWEVHDTHKVGHGASHLSLPWAWDLRGFAGSCSLVTGLVPIVRKAYASSTPFLPEHYASNIISCIQKGVLEGTLPWVHGERKRAILAFMTSVVGCNFCGTTQAKRRAVGHRIECAMNAALAPARQP